MSAIENRYESYYGSYDKSKDLLESLSDSNTGTFRTFMKQVESRYKNIDFFYTLFNKYRSNPQAISNLIINVINKFSANENFSKTQKINLLRTIGIALNKMDNQNSFGQKVLTLLEGTPVDASLRRLEMGNTYKELLVLNSEEAERVVPSKNEKSERLLNIYWRERVNIGSGERPAEVDKNYKERLIAEKELDNEKDEFVPGATRTALLGYPFYVFGSIYDSAIIKDKDEFWGMIHMYKDPKTDKFKNTVGLWDKQKSINTSLSVQITQDYYVSTTRDVKGIFLDSRGIGKNYFKKLNEQTKLGKLLKRNLYIPFKAGVTSPLEKVEGETPKRAKNREILISILSNAKAKGILKIQNNDLKDFFDGKALGTETAKPARSAGKQSVSYEQLFKALIESTEFRSLYPTHHQFLQSLYDGSKFNYKPLKTEDQLELLAETIFITASIFSGGDITATASNSEELYSFENKFFNGDDAYFMGYNQIKRNLTQLKTDSIDAPDVIERSEKQIKTLEKYVNTVIYNSSDLLSNPEIKQFADSLKQMVVSLNQTLEIKKALLAEKEIRATMQASEKLVLYAEVDQLRNLSMPKGVSIAKDYDDALRKYANKKGVSEISLSKDQRAEFAALFKVYIANKKLGFYFDGEKYTAISKIYSSASESDQRNFFKNPEYAGFEKSADMQYFILNNRVRSLTKTYNYTSIEDPQRKSTIRTLSNEDKSLFEKNIGDSDSPEKADHRSLQYQINFYQKAFREVSDTNKDFAIHYSKAENRAILQSDTDNHKDDLNLGVKKFAEQARKDIYSKNVTDNKDLNLFITRLTVSELKQVKEALPEGYPRDIDLKPHRDDSAVLIIKERLQVVNRGREVNVDADMSIERKKEFLKRDEEATLFLEAVKNGKKEEAQKIAEHSGESDYVKLVENNKSFEDCVDAVHSNLLSGDSRKGLVKDVYFEDKHSVIKQETSENEYTKKANNSQDTLIKELALYNSFVDPNKGNLNKQIVKKDLNNAQIEFSKKRVDEITAYQKLIENSFTAQKTLAEARNNYQKDSTDENYARYKSGYVAYIDANKKVAAFKFTTSKTVGTQKVEDGKADRAIAEQKSTVDAVKQLETVEAHQNKLTCSRRRREAK